MARTPVMLLVLAGALAAQNYPPPFPRTGATLVLENDRVEVWDVFWPKGQPSPMHQHPYDQISITLTPGSIKVTRPDGKASVGESKYASASFVRKGTIHAEEGMSEEPQHKIMVEVKAPTAPAAPPGDWPGATKILDNDCAVVWDFTYKPGQNAPSHADDHASVTVFLEGGTIRSSATEVVRKAGDVVYSPPGSEAPGGEAVGGSPRVIIVELK